MTDYNKVKMARSLFEDLLNRSEKLKEFEAIGTIEEFKALKDGSIPIIHGKAELELHDAEIINKAIQEFAERLKDLIAKNVEDAESSNDLCCEIFQSEIDEIAMQMKGVRND